MIATESKPRSLGSALAARGRKAEGRARCEQALALARELGDRYVSSAP